MGSSPVAVSLPALADLPLPGSFPALALSLSLAVSGLIGCSAARGPGSPHPESVAGGPALGTYGAPTAEGALGAFLDALRAGDYPAMARLFGTPSGPAREEWGVEETEQRMLVLVGVLGHEEARIRPARRTVTDHRRRPFFLTLTGTRYGTAVLPVTVARDGSGRWFVERIDTSRFSP